jgi:DNA-binding GntR family transcriptional regulator
VELNHRFHMSLYRLSRRERLIELIAGLRSASAAYLQIYAAEGVPSERLDHEHREILAACEARDPKRAARAMRHHLEQTVAHVTRHLAHDRGLRAPDRVGHRSLVQTAERGLSLDRVGAH